MSHQPDYILQVRGLTKSFSGVKALNQVRLDVRKGEVHALMGENGAGKSTLMKILIGLETPDAGEIIFDGHKLLAHGREARKNAISMIHQEMLLVPELTVAQNIFLGRETSRRLFGWLNDAALTKQAGQLLTQMGAGIRPDVPVKYLSVAQMQMVEIAKAILFDARVIIMDEPTSALSDKEVATLFGIIAELKKKGVAIIYISHKMDEIFTISDTITVLRDGQYIGTHPASEVTSSGLITLMVGREIDTLFPERTPPQTAEVLSVKQLSQHGKFTDINFSVHAGEVLGMAGLMGAGRTEVARVLYGLEQPDAGDICLNGESVHIQSPEEAIRLGIGYVSEDRKQFGFIPRLSIRQNLTLTSLRAYTNGLFVDPDREQEVADGMMANLNVKASGPDQQVRYLSGGNQQKVVIGKVLLSSPTLIILDEPTRGIDIGAKAEIYKLIHQLKQAGTAIILISSELPELLGLSDRMVVLAKGKQTATLLAHTATQEIIMQYAMQP